MGPHQNLLDFGTKNKTNPLELVCKISKKILLILYALSYVWHIIHFFKLGKIRFYKRLQTCAELKLKTLLIFTTVD